MAVTITCTITTAHTAGTDSDKATMTLATRGVVRIPPRRTPPHPSIPKSRCSLAQVERPSNVLPQREFSRLRLVCCLLPHKALITGMSISRSQDQTRPLHTRLLLPTTENSSVLVLEDQSRFQTLLSAQETRSRSSTTLQAT